jgi:hypothetical protein
MKVVATEAGRVLDLVPLEELRSRRGVYFPDFVNAIVSRYGFVTPPASLQESMKSGAKFEIGKFTVNGEDVVIKELGIYNDGLICEAFDTTFAELALDDFMQWAADTFGLQERTSPIQRTYTSALVCIFDKAIEAGLGKLSGICELLSRALNASYGWDYQFSLSRLAFNVDPKAIPTLRATNFILERRVQADYSENRYFSIAPLKTDEHIDLLRRLEDELLRVN